MIKDNIDKILNEIENIKNLEGIKYKIDLMAVSKTYPVEDIIEAYNCGLKLFGENRVQEAHSKFTILKEQYSDINLHIIGHLQRNKVKKAIDVSSTVQSIDKLETLKVLDNSAKLSDKSIDYLIEVNTSNEPQKSGVFENEVDQLINHINQSSLSNVNIRGLMTVGPLTDDNEEIRRSFRTLKKIFDSVKMNLNNDHFNILSMGMSGDYKIAIEEGSNLLRIGSKIFGKRNYQ